MQYILGLFHLEAAADHSSLQSVMDLSAGTFWDRSQYSFLLGTESEIEKSIGLISDAKSVQKVF